MNRKTIPAAFLIPATLLLAALSASAQQDYINDFFEEGFPHYNVETGWSLDTAGGVHSLSIGGGTRNRFAAAPLSEWVGADFVVSNWIRIQRAEGGGGSPASVGLTALDSTGSGGNYYLAYWGVAGGGDGAARLNILRVGGGNFTVYGDDEIGLPEIGKTYELRLTGEYDGGDLNLTLALFDAEGTQIGGSTTTTDSSPLTGEYFGVRNRTAGGSHFLDVDHYRFSVSSEVLPEPDMVLVEFSGLHPEPGAVFHPHTEGLGFTVGTTEGNVIDTESIELSLNEVPVPQEELAITVVSPSLVEVFYDGLEANVEYTAEAVAGDNTGERSISWSFNTYDGTTQEDYINDFYEEGFPFYNVTTGWTLDIDNGVHSLSIGGGINNRFATASLPEWIGSDFVSSVWFSVENVEGGGTSPISVGHVAHASSTSGGNYYLAYWGLGGGGAGETGDLVILRTGGGNFRVDGGVAGPPGIGERYELRLTGEYNASGELVLRLAVYDENGQQVGTATEATEPGTPLAGEFFGIRDRTAESDQFLDVDHYRYSLSSEVLPPPPPVLVEVTNLNPEPDTAFHPVGEGLSFTVSTDPSRQLDPSDIELYLNGEVVPQGELDITGASPSFDVVYTGALEPDTFYTARVLATDNEAQGGRTWDFNTYSETIARTGEDIALNQSTGDAIQGVVGDSDSAPVAGSLATLTDATSPAAPAGNVILSPDEPVAVTWDLAGASEDAAHRQLVQIDVWLAGNDPWRTGFDGELAVSNDGVNFTPVPGSRFASALTYTGDTLTIDGVEVEGTGTGDFNLVRYFFHPDDIDGSFQYLRFISHGYDNLDEGILRQPRIVEIDAFVTTAPPFISQVAPADGTIFHPAGDGLTFNASTEAPNTIATGDIELYLNGEDVSGDLTITGSSPNFEVAYEALEPDRFYTATAVVRDNERETSFSWRFDTLSEAGSVVIEAEDYNFTEEVDCDGITGEPDGDLETAAGGAYFDNPVPSTFTDGNYYPADRENAYADRVGVPGVDFHSEATVSGELGVTMYRWCDVVGTDVSDDWLRPKYEEAFDTHGVVIPDYHLHLVQTGEWFNYTRNFPAGDYEIHLRASVTGGSPVMRLERVVSDPTGGDQATEPLGRFEPDGSGGFTYTSLSDVDGLGQPVVVALSGEETLRLTAENGANANINVNFLAAVPTTNQPPEVVSLSPVHRSGNVSADATLEAEIRAGAGGLDLTSIKFFVNEEEVAATVTQTAEGAIVSHTPGGLPALQNTARVEFDDGEGGGPYGVEWQFSVRPEVTSFHALAFEYDDQGQPLGHFVDITLAGGTFGDFTVSGWFNIGDAGQEQVLYRLTNQESVTRTIELREDGGVLTAGIRVQAGSGGPLHTLSSSNFAYDTWVHIALVRDGDQFLLYFDGELETSDTVPETPVVVEGRSFLGANPWPWDQPGANFFRGYIDEFQIWSRARTRQEIADSMFEPLHELIQPGDGLHARFGLNEGSGVQTFDYSSGNGFVGQVNATWVESEIFESVAPPELPVLTLAREGQQFVISWEEEPDVVLESTDDLSEGWAPVEGAGSPHAVDPSEAPVRFFRLRLNE